MAKITEGSLTGPKKPNSMTTVGELKKTVRNMRRENIEREDERTMIQQNRNIGISDEQERAAGQRIAQLRKEKAYYAPIIDRYQGLINTAVRNSKIPLAPTQFPGKK